MPSYNKRGFGVEAAKSVIEQGFSDWELWIMENSTDDKTRKLLAKFLPLDDPRIHYEELDLDEVRKEHWPAPWLLNKYYPKANGDIIMYVSDDDLFVPDIFRATVDAFDCNPEVDCIYFDMARTRARRPSDGKEWHERIAEVPALVVRDKAAMLDCLIDGGQVAYRKLVLDDIGQPYFYDGKDFATAMHTDGLHLSAIAEVGHPFYPLHKPGVIHRHTLISTWSQRD